MVDDQLSEVLDLVQVRALLTGGIAATGSWVARGAIDDPLKFFAMICGRVRLSTDGLDEPIELAPGDIAILNNRSWLEIRGGPGEGPRHEIRPESDLASAHFIGADRTHHDILIGGCVDLSPAGRTLLAQALPPVGHVRAAAAATTDLPGNLDRLFDELTGHRMGSAFAIRQYGQLLLLGLLRAYVDQAELAPGWLRLLTDEPLRPALHLMHSEPAKPWGLQELARAAAMSRTTFAERFRTVAGVPPLTYLSRWRMLLAQRALRDGDVRIGSLASELGYASESAFSTAFKREVGESPRRYRHRNRREQPVTAQSL